MDLSSPVVRCGRWLANILLSGMRGLIGRNRPRHHIASEIDDTPILERDTEWDGIQSEPHCPRPNIAITRFPDGAEAMHIEDISLCSGYSRSSATGIPIPIPIPISRIGLRRDGSPIANVHNIVHAYNNRENMSYQESNTSEGIPFPWGLSHNLGFGANRRQQPLNEMAERGYRCAQRAAIAFMWNRSYSIRRALEFMAEHADKPTWQLQHMLEQRTQKMLMAGALAEGIQVREVSIEQQDQDQNDYLEECVEYFADDELEDFELDGYGEDFGLNEGYEEHLYQEDEVATAELSYENYEQAESYALSYGGTRLGVSAY